MEVEINTGSLSQAEEEALAHKLYELLQPERDELAAATLILAAKLSDGCSYEDLLAKRDEFLRLNVRAGGRFND